MNNYALESFISFCDDMMIAEEGILPRIKDILIGKQKSSREQKNAESITIKNSTSNEVYFFEYEKINGVLTQETYGHDQLRQTILSISYRNPNPDIMKVYEGVIYLINSTFLNKMIYLYKSSNIIDKGYGRYVKQGTTPELVYEGTFSNLCKEFNVPLVKTNININSNKKKVLNFIKKVKSTFSKIEGMTIKFDDVDLHEFCFTLPIEKENEALIIGEFVCKYPDGRRSVYDIEKTKASSENIFELCNKFTSSNSDFYVKFAWDTYYEEFSKGYLYLQWK